MKLYIQPDLEKSRSMIKLVSKRKDFINKFKNKAFTTVICENYYEIIKELATALFLSKGIKFVGEYAHKELIEETIKFLNLETSYFVFLDDLRIRRNGSLYYGEPFEDIYLKNNENKIKFIISSVEKFLNKEFGDIK